MNRFLKLFSLAAFSGLLFAGCYPNGPDYTEDLDVVYTTFDDSYDFQSQSTYARPDKIVVDVEIANNGDTIYEYMKDIYAGPILQRIDENMSNLGWTKVDISAGPDVLVQPAGISSTTYFYSYWYCWWYGGWYGGWGWYYPPYYTVSSYTTGSMIIVISDPNLDSPINSSPTAWIAAANGLLTDSGDVGRALDGIDQAFEQSPYLKNELISYEHEKDLFLYMCFNTLCSYYRARTGRQQYFRYICPDFLWGPWGFYTKMSVTGGVTIDFRSMAKENLGIGVSLGWNVFYEEKDYDTYTAGNASLSGKQWRYSNHVPMLVSADYYFKPLEKINPFIGLEPGVVYTRRNTDMNLYTIEQEAWNFALQPEVGIQIQNDFSSGFTIMAKYYNGFAAGDLPENQSYLTLNVGMVFR